MLDPKIIEYPPHAKLKNMEFTPRIENEDKRTKSESEITKSKNSQKRSVYYENSSNDRLIYDAVIIDIACDNSGYHCGDFSSCG